MLLNVVCRCTHVIHIPSRRRCTGVNLSRCKLTRARIRTQGNVLGDVEIRNTTRERRTESSADKGAQDTAQQDAPLDMRRRCAYSDQRDIDNPKSMHALMALRAWPRNPFAWTLTILQVLSS